MSAPGRFPDDVLVGIRAQFPVLGELGPDGQPLCYLDTAASSQKPLAVVEAVRAYYLHDHANVHRGAHTLGRRATEAYEGARARVAAFLSARPDEVIFTRGTTEALNLAANALAPRLGAGDRVLVTAMDHHSNLVPWQLVASARGAGIDVVPVRPDGTLDPDAYASLVGPRTKVVAFGHVSNALGTVNPVARMAEQARRHGAIVVVDGAQAAPHGLLDVRATGADLYALSGHKMYGPTGIGVLWGRRDLLAELPPWQGGGEMIEVVRLPFGTTYAPPPARFEAGTPNIAGAVGLAAAADWMTSVGRQAIAAHEQALLQQATSAVASVRGLRVVGTAPDKAGVLSFVVDGAHPHDLGTLLDEQGVGIRTGHHCAQPLMASLGVDATARASFGAYTSPVEIDRFVAALHKAVALLC